MLVGEAMASLDDLAVISAKLPGSEVGERGLSVMVKGKLQGFCWTWAERVHPKKARVINPNVLAVRTPNLSAKELLIATEPDKFFTEPHYNGYPAVLVRLEAVTLEELEDLLIEAWRTLATKEMLQQWGDSQKN